MDRLAELRTLIAIVDAGSLAAAARRLGRSPPSVTRDLADLERRVGAALVERSTRACRPTPAGTRLASEARRLIEGYDDAIAAAGGETVAATGLIRITAPTTFGSDHVAPLVTAFLDTHAGISVDLHLVDRLVDLVEEDYDLAVRIGPLADSQLVARSVGELRRVVVASPAYLADRGTPARPEDLARHEVIHHPTGGPKAQWTFRDPDGRPCAVTVDARLTVNQPGAAIAAARDGRGIIEALSHQVAEDLADGRLVRLLREFEPAAIPVSLVWPASRRGWRRMRLMIDHLSAGLGALDVLHPD